MVIAQYAALRRQIPFLYLLLIVNAGAVAYTHYRVAPFWLTVGCTGVLLPIALWRLLAWTSLMSPTAATVDAARARRALRIALIAIVPICLAFWGWAAALDQYGGPLHHAHIAVFSAITVIGCIFCLGYLPQGALLTAVSVTVPFVGYHLYRGDPIFIAMALNITLVVALMLHLLFKGFSVFTELVLSQARLAAQQAETQRLAEENARLALTDALTGLPNRRFFFGRLESMLDACAPDQKRFAVGVVDLDRFKPVNDAYGHAMGNRVLVAIGSRLAEFVDQGLTIARLGGDEFGMIVTGDMDKLNATAQQICTRLAEPLEIDEQRLSVGCSVGISIFPDAGSTADTLFDGADFALYNVKSTRRGGYALFSREHATHIREELALDAALQAADLDRELHVEFQAIQCIQTMAVQGVEALGRWTSPVLGEVAPDRFIIAAERLGLMHIVTVRLFRKALASFAEIDRPIGMSFNLSAHDIVSPETIRQLVAALHEARVNPRRITFELTETALMRDFDAAVVGIKLLRDLGVTIALDDFGMGYSSLSHLHRLPLDKVKVDRSFVADMDEDAGSKIIAAIIGLCTTLELECIIEGVETDKQLRQLRDLGCHLAQGYLLARPMALPALLAWLKPVEPTRARNAPRSRRPLPALFAQAAEGVAKPVVH